MAEGTNPTAVGYDLMRDRLSRLLRQGLEHYGVSPSRVAAVCAGIAGMRVESVRQRAQLELGKICAGLGLKATACCTVTTDQHIALRGALHPGQETGILIVAGTGSGAIGLARDRLYTCGGWGHRLGDEGSGYAIGLQGLKAVCRAHDGRSGPTVLKELLLAALELAKVEELIPYMHEASPSKREIAGLARAVAAAAEQSDQQAIRILRQAADDWLDLIRGLAGQTSHFDEGTPVMGTGSIFNRMEGLRRQFAEGLRRERLGMLQEKHGSSLDGTVFIALESIQAPKMNK